MRIRCSHFQTFFLVLFGAGALTACSEVAGSGAATTIPQVVVNCASALCRSNSSPVVHVRITKFDCAPSSDGFASASSSLQIFCTVSSGCYGTTSSWINDRGETLRTLPAGTYTVCGRIDYQNNYPGVTTDDTTSIKESVAISSSSSGPVDLTSWVDP